MMPPVLLPLLLIGPLGIPPSLGLVPIRPLGLLPSLGITPLGLLPSLGITPLGGLLPSLGLCRLHASGIMLSFLVHDLFPRSVKPSTQLLCGNSRCVPIPQQELCPHPMHQAACITTADCMREDACHRILEEI